MSAAVAPFKLSVVPPVAVPAFTENSMVLFPPPLSQAIISLSFPDSYPKYPTPLPDEWVTRSASPKLLAPFAPISIYFVFPLLTESVKLTVAVSTPTSRLIFAAFNLVLSSVRKLPPLALK